MQKSEGATTTKIPSPRPSSLKTSPEEFPDSPSPVATIDGVEGKPLPPKKEVSKPTPPKANTQGSSPRASKNNVTIERRVSSSSSASAKEVTHASKKDTSAQLVAPPGENTEVAKKQTSAKKSSSVDSSLEEAKRNACLLYTSPSPRD